MDNSAPIIDVDMNDFNGDFHPYETYETLLESTPVCRFRSGNFALCRYEDVKDALRNWQTFSEGVSSQARAEGWLPPDCQNEVFLISKSPPEHERLRALVNKNFIPATINQYIPELKERTRSLTKTLLESGGPADFVTSFAYPLASTASSLATGITDNPSYSETIRKWSYLSELSRPDSPESHQRAVILETRKLHHIYAEIIDERKKKPRHDLVSLLLNSLFDQRPLPYETLCGALGLFLSAGFMTTAQSLSAAIYELARQPALKRSLSETSELIPHFIEELLRFRGPTHSVMRLTKAPVTLHQTTIPTGSRVHLLLGAANRDSRQFKSPNRFIPGRSNIKTHVAFGHGIHVCIGAAMVRLVLRVALTEILRAFSSHRFRITAEHWSSTLFTRGLDELQIALEKDG